MIFNGSDNQFVELKIANYQFPSASTSDAYNANWLNIYLSVTSKQGHWKTVDPSLLTWEFESIVKWFSDLAENKALLDELNFTEPNLSFQVLENKPDMKKVRIKFDLECRPKSANDDTEYYVDGVFTNKQLQQLSNDFAQELSKFPQRY